MASPTTTISRIEYSPGIAEIDLAASRKGFIAPSVLRPRSVAKQAADIGLIPLAQLLANRTTVRSPKSGYSRADFEFETTSYRCLENGAEEVLDDASLAIFADVIDAEAVHAQRAVDVVLRNFEREAAAAIFNETTWSGDLTDGASVAWDVPETAAPIDDVIAACRAVHDRCGFWPNAVIFNRKTFQNLGQCDQVLERIVSGGSTSKPAVATADALAQLFTVDRVLIADAAYNSAAEGQPAVIAPIWSDSYCMVCRVAETDDFSEPCIGRTFMFADDGPTGSRDDELAILVEEYREEGRRGSILRARTYWDARVILPEAGHLITGVKTA